MGAFLLFQAACGTLWGKGPLDKLIPFKKSANKEPQNTDDETAAYRLTDDDGPWMVMCVTFSGEQSNQQAKELVNELRKKHKLKAYYHEVTFDHTKDVQPLGVDRYGNPKKIRYRLDRAHEVAVLVGNFGAVDDPRIEKALKKLRKLTPDCMNLDKIEQEGKKDFRALGAWREAEKDMFKQLGLGDSKLKGPLGRAFVTKNPLLPDEYFVPKGLDKFVAGMNRNLKYSLLKCPGKYSVKIATFSGTVLIKQDEVKKVLNRDKPLKETLEEAGEKAHKMTLALREKGVEAYEFHDRYSSIVTVGSFQTVGTPRQDGKIEIDPAVHTIIETYGANKDVTETGVNVGKAKTLDGMHFDVSPIPVYVPKESIASKYER